MENWTGEDRQSKRSCKFGIFTDALYVDKDIFAQDLISLNIDKQGQH